MYRVLIVQGLIAAEGSRVECSFPVSILSFLCGTCRVPLTCAHAHFWGDLSFACMIITWSTSLPSCNLQITACEHIHHLSVHCICTELSLSYSPYPLFSLRELWFPRTSHCHHFFLFLFFMAKFEWFHSMLCSEYKTTTTVFIAGLYYYYYLLSNISDFLLYVRSSSWLPQARAELYCAALHWTMPFSGNPAVMKSREKEEGCYTSNW